MARCGEILNDWIDETPWMPRIHSHEDVIRYHAGFVFENRDVLVAENDGNDVQGFAATSSDAIVTGFYLAPEARQKGLGLQLLNNIKQAYPSGLSLWTFVANTGARKFYEREGFTEERRTDGDNEENLPDILYRWQPEGAAA
nr:GNAT family N-acetyltransferase [uncultured Roseibium sp.]